MQKQRIFLYCSYFVHTKIFCLLREPFIVIFTENQHQEKHWKGVPPWLKILLESFIHNKNPPCTPQMNTAPPRPLSRSQLCKREHSRLDYFYNCQNLNSQCDYCSSYGEENHTYLCGRIFKFAAVFLSWKKKRMINFTEYIIVPTTFYTFIC